MEFRLGPTLTALQESRVLGVGRGGMGWEIGIDMYSLLILRIE